MQLHLQPIDVGDLIREVCIGLTKEFAERSLTLTVDLPALPMLKADPNTLHKVFFHLVTNAIKFTPNDGKITIAGQDLPPRSKNTPEGGVQITISDTGIGIDPEYRDLIFTKFYQPGELGKHSTSKSRFKGGGAGLGLALAKGIVEAHGGRIWVESPGYDETHFPGSHFHVILPLHRPEKGEMIEMEMGRAIKMTL